MTLTELYTPAMAMKVLQCTAKTLKAYVQNGELSYIQKGAGTKRRRRLFHPDDIAAFIVRRRRVENPPMAKRGRDRQSSNLDTPVDFTQVRPPALTKRLQRSRMPLSNVIPSVSGKNAKR